LKVTGVFFAAAVGAWITAVGARLVTTKVRVAVTTLASSSVTRRRTVLVPDVSKMRDASMSVPSSKLPSLSVSQRTSTIEPSGSLDVEVKVTRCSESGVSGLNWKAAVGGWPATVTVLVAVWEPPSLSVIFSRTVLLPGEVKAFWAVCPNASS
jgi:hypothetical protein